MLDSIASDGGSPGRGGQAERTAWPLLRGWMSMKASVFSLSKSLKEGISPVLSRGVSHQGSWGAGTSCVMRFVKSLGPRGRHTPLMILQKIQVAILLDMSVHLQVNSWARGNWLSERQIRVVRARKAVRILTTEMCRRGCGLKVRGLAPRGTPGRVFVGI